MSQSTKQQVLEQLAGCLDIPDSAYDKAEARYEDLGKWFCREGAHCAPFKPHIYPQGSFRLGTVINADEYDLDMGCRLREGITKLTHTQEQLKRLVGLDLEEYRQARGIEQRLEEKSRCWRLKYKDELAFHLDAVPSIPDEQHHRKVLQDAMVKYGAAQELAADVTQHSGSITDNRMSNYAQSSSDWKTSNSEGYAKWFESRMMLATQLMEKRASSAKVARIDELPARKWKSPLQRSIQILKCHRDRMFEDSPDGKPISVILTTLAAQAYQGEQEVSDALEGILRRMGDLVRNEKPRVPNPVNPAEDFADKWYDWGYRHLNLEENFWNWLRQARVDFELIGGSQNADFISEQAMTKFGASLSAGIMRQIGVDQSSVAATPRIHTITEPAKPWVSN